MKIKNPRYDRLFKIHILESILHPVRFGISPLRLGAVSLKTSSLRLKTFASRGVVCASCGLEGSFFAVERNYSHRHEPFDEKPFHLNLWALTENDEEVLMTHDHIIARVLGGSDSIENTQTMCEKCNSKKSTKENKLITLMRELDLTTVTIK